MIALAPATNRPAFPRAVSRLHKTARPAVWYVVIRLLDGQSLYIGQNETKAAIALEPGTTYARNALCDVAERAAQEHRRLHLQG